MFDGAIEVDLAGLPASLQTLTVTSSCNRVPWNSWVLTLTPVLP